MQFAIRPSYNDTDKKGVEVLFLEFDQQSRKIIAAAEAEKARFGAVGSECLLLAMLKTKNTLCWDLLQENVSLKTLEEELSKLALLRKSTTSHTFKLLEILKNARTAALLEKSKHVFPEHLLYALLTTSPSVALDVLERIGADVAFLLEELNNIYSDEEDSEHGYLVNITKEAKCGRLNPFIGREELIDKIIRILSKKQKNNPMLIGSAGVGKSALVEGVAMRMLKVNPKINIFRLDLGMIIAGTKYRGDLEERLIEVIDRIKNPHSIIFIDEIHNIVGSGSSEGTLDIANILKPILARSEIKCIGATTLEEYYRYIEKDKALSRRFQNVYVDEASPEETLEILRGISRNYEDFHKVNYKDQILKYIIASSAFLANRKLPDKAIDILDEAGLVCRLSGRRNVSKADVDKIVFESLGIRNEGIYKKIKTVPNFKNLAKYYFQYFINLGIRKTILSLQASEDCLDLLLEDFRHVFNIKDEVVLKLDFNRFHESFHTSSLIGAPAGYVGYENGGILTEHALKYPISVIVIKNYRSGSRTVANQIESILSEGVITDAKGREVNFRNSIFVFLEADAERQIGYLGEAVEGKVMPLIDEVVRDPKKNGYYLEKLRRVLERMKSYNYNLVLEIPELDRKTYAKVLNELSNLDNFKQHRTYVIKYVDNKILFEMKK
jgi:ATP-dependent Clp protease ATP-binding subunit ClpC